jgi:hypothetical protein
MPVYLCRTTKYKSSNSKKQEYKLLPENVLLIDVGGGAAGIS